jgi:hypothetical protein
VVLKHKEHEGRSKDHEDGGDFLGWDLVAGDVVGGAGDAVGAGGGEVVEFGVLQMRGES